MKKKTNEEFQGIDLVEYDLYLNGVLHQWLKTLTMLGITLVPVFFILDYLTTPPELALRFGLYRIISVFFVFIQYLVIRFTRPGPYSYIHGFVISINISGIISIMTVHLGGFNSGYYAGLNLVMVAVNMLLPWKPIHSMTNSLIIILFYCGCNLLFGKEYKTVALINHLFFMFGTAIISVSINYVKNRLEKREFFLRAELKKTRDALWGEMEIAQRIQTALLPHKKTMACGDTVGIGCYGIAATMIAAEEVGGDYYDIIETNRGECWVGIGDVTGHGVESGLIMMMTQTSIFSMVNNTHGYNPSSILRAINKVMIENIARLETDRYIAVSLFRFDKTSMVVAGKHQDVLIHRSASKIIEEIKTEGTWIGIYENIRKHTPDLQVPIEIGDTVLLFTDGVTEATNKNGLMYGQERLKALFAANAELPIDDVLKIIIADVSQFWDKQYDDVTALVIRRER